MYYFLKWINFSVKEKTLKTRLHSSRMRTARALTVSPSMLCAGGVPPGGVLLWGGLLLGGCLLLGGLLQGGVSQHALRQTPPVNRMTNRCKNITLPQTSFAGGNYGENVKSAGKVREFCQSGKVGTMRTSALAFLNSNRTRMHSSRMHTAHSSSRPGGLHQAPHPDQTPSPRPGTHPPLWTDTHL